MSHRYGFALLFAGMLATAAHAENKTLEFVVEAGNYDRVNVPVHFLYNFDFALPGVQSVTLKDAQGKPVPAQLMRAGRLNLTPTKPFRGMEKLPFELHFILPSLKAGEKATFTATISTDPPPKPEGFFWRDMPDEFLELKFDGRPVLKYMYKPLDESSKEARELTYKPFHHLYDPAGERLVTKGPGGQYTHHRGLFYGFNKVTYGDGKKADVWHCTGNAYQAHVETLDLEGGPIVARHRVRIHWHGQDKEPFASEIREVTVYRVPGGHLIGFVSDLDNTVGGVTRPIKLDGDPQHAGFHFRADNEVSAKTKGQTYFLRPDGKGKPGETRNWPAQKDHVNLPWLAMSFVLGEQRYTALYLDHPKNPKEARFSERDYGRFGSYFAREMDENPRGVSVNYRLWLQEGELTAEQAAAHSANFVAPLRVWFKDNPPPPDVKIP